MSRRAFISDQISISGAALVVRAIELSLFQVGNGHKRGEHTSGPVVSRRIPAPQGEPVSVSVGGSPMDASEPKNQTSEKRQLVGFLGLLASNSSVYKSSQAGSFRFTVPVRRFSPRSAPEFSGHQWSARPGFLPCGSRRTTIWAVKERTRLDQVWTDGFLCMRRGRRISWSGLWRTDGHQRRSPRRISPSYHTYPY